MILVAHTRSAGMKYASDTGLEPDRIVVSTGGAQQVQGLEAQRVVYAPGPSALVPNKELQRALDEVQEKVRRCRDCGCTESTPCVVLTGEGWLPCAWVGESSLCTGCLPGVESRTYAEHGHG